MSDSKGYWIAGPETRAAIDARIARHIDARKRQADFAKRHGTKELWGEKDQSRVGGLVFSNPPPAELWRKHPKHWNVWIPRRSTAEGKALAKEMDGLGYDSRFGVECHFARLAMHHPGYHIFGKGKNAVYVVKHHPDAKVPADCKPLKASKYFQMVEAEESRAAKHADGRGRGK